MTTLTGMMLLGARVRTDAGLLGTLERLEETPIGDGPACLLVRTLDNQHWYRFPVDLVHHVGTEDEQSVSYAVIMLNVAADDLAHYALTPSDEATTGEQQPPTAPAPSGTGSIAARIPVLEEQLVVQVQPVQQGSVHVHKAVETGEQVLHVPVSREEVLIDRLPAEHYDATAPANPEETIIPVMEERLVVETRQVVVEYLRIRKRSVTRQQEVRAQVRREQVTVTERDTEGRITGAATSPANTHEQGDG